MKQHEVDSSLADLPDDEDVKQALSQVKNSKAAGSLGILPELLKVGQMSQWQVSYKAIKSREKLLNLFNQSHLAYITPYHATGY